MNSERQKACCAGPLHRLMDTDLYVAFDSSKSTPFSPLVDGTPLLVGDASESRRRNSNC